MTAQRDNYKQSEYQRNIGLYTEDEWADLVHLAKCRIRPTSACYLCMRVVVARSNEVARVFEI